MLFPDQSETVVRRGPKKRRKTSLMPDGSAAAAVCWRVVRRMGRRIVGVVRVVLVVWEEVGYFAPG